MSPKKIPKTEIGFDQKKHVFHYESNAYQNTPFPELTLSLHYDFAVLPIARDGHLRRNTLVNLQSAFTRRIMYSVNNQWQSSLYFSTIIIQF